MPVQALEFYSGIGGLHLALGESHVDGRVVRAFDWDQTACRVYALNHGKDNVQKVDITTLDADYLASYQADLWLMSPSCQPYTVLNPLAKGAEDPRAKSFIHIIEDILPQMASGGSHPRYMLIENVAGFETSSTRQRLLATLANLDYNVLELLLTPLQFGVPNSRLRYYLLAKARPMLFSHVSPDTTCTLWRHIPGKGSDWIDNRQHPGLQEGAADQTAYSIEEIRRYLDPPLERNEPHPCTVPDRVLEKWGRLFDIIPPSARRSCCFTRGYSKMAERSGSVLQMNEELDTTSVFDQFLAAQGDGQADAVRILDPLRLRYFTPTELLRMFCFLPTNTAAECGRQLEFYWPEDLSTKAKYRLIGNSVNVRVVANLIDYMFQ